jgi:hypothetical protein
VYQRPLEVQNNKQEGVRLDIFRVMKIYVVVFQVMTSCGDVVGYQCFRRLWPSITLMTHLITTWDHNPDNCDLYKEEPHIIMKGTMLSEKLKNTNKVIIFIRILKKKKVKM